MKGGNSQHLQELELWWRNSDDDDDDDNHLLLPSFPPSLSHLQIIECPNFTSMPLIPDLTSLKALDISSCPLLRQRGKQWRLAHPSLLISQIIQQEKNNLFRYICIYLFIIPNSKSTTAFLGFFIFWTSSKTFNFFLMLNWTNLKLGYCNPSFFFFFLSFNSIDLYVCT